MVPELPRQILLFESQIVQVEFKTNKFGFLNSQSVSGSLLDRNVPSDANGILLLLKGLCVSIVWTKKHYFLFDSHSKNEKGECIPEGYSILLKFNSINALESHIIENYLNENDRDVQFEIQYIQVIKTNDQFNFSGSYHELKERERKTSDTQKEKSRKRSATDTQKEKSRKRSATDTQKEKSRKRSATDTQKEKSRKRSATDTQKEKSQKRSATDAIKEKNRKRMSTDIEKKKSRIRVASHKAKVKSDEEMSPDKVYYKRISAFKAAVRAIIFVTYAIAVFIRKLSKIL